jgi:hypothetical protein
MKLNLQQGKQVPKVMCECVDWIELGQDTVQWKAFVKPAVKLGVL